MPVSSKIPFQNYPQFQRFLDYSARVFFIALFLFGIKMYLEQPSPDKHNSQVKLVKMKIENMMAGCRLYWKSDGDDKPCSLSDIKEFFRPHAMVNIKIVKPYKEDFLAVASHVGANVQFKIESKGSSGTLAEIEK